MDLASSEGGWELLGSGPGRGQLPRRLGLATVPTPSPVRDWGRLGRPPPAACSSASLPPSPSLLHPSAPLHSWRVTTYSDACASGRLTRAPRATGPHLALCGLCPASARPDQYQFTVKRRGCLPVNEFPQCSPLLMNPLNRV